MIDRNQRELGAELLEQFLSGEINSDDVTLVWPRGSEDAAIIAIGQMFTLAFAACGPTRLLGDRSRFAREVDVIGRCAAFLESDLLYDWPVTHFDHQRRGLGQLVPLSLGLLWPLDAWLRSRTNAMDAAMAAHGDLETWPFVDRRQWESTAMPQAPTTPHLRAVAQAHVRSMSGP